MSVSTKDTATSTAPKPEEAVAGKRVRTLSLDQISIIIDQELSEVAAMAPWLEPIATFIKSRQIRYDVAGLDTLAVVQKLDKSGVAVGRPFMAVDSGFVESCLEEVPLSNGATMVNPVIKFALVHEMLHLYFQHLGRKAKGLQPQFNTLLTECQVNASIETFYPDLKLYFDRSKELSGYRTALMPGAEEATFVVPEKIVEAMKEFIPASEHPAGGFRVADVFADYNTAVYWMEKLQKYAPKIPMPSTGCSHGQQQQGQQGQQQGQQGQQGGQGQQGQQQGQQGQQGGQGQDGQQQGQQGQQGGQGQQGQQQGQQGQQGGQGQDGQQQGQRGQGQPGQSGQGAGSGGGEQVSYTDRVAPEILDRVMGEVGNKVGEATKGKYIGKTNDSQQIGDILEQNGGTAAQGYTNTKNGRSSTDLGIEQKDREMSEILTTIVKALTDHIRATLPDEDKYKITSNISIPKLVASQVANQNLPEEQRIHPTFEDKWHQEKTRLVCISVDMSGSMYHIIEVILHELLGQSKDFTVINVLFDDGGIITYDGRTDENFTMITVPGGGGTRADDVVAFAEGRDKLKNRTGHDIEIDDPENTVHVLITDTWMDSPGITKPDNLILLPTCKPEEYQDWATSFETAGGRTVNIADELAELQAAMNRTKTNQNQTLTNTPKTTLKPKKTSNHTKTR